MIWSTCDGSEADAANDVAGIARPFRLPFYLSSSQKESSHDQPGHHGRKTSKSLGNVIDPDEVLTQFGPDALRFGLLRAARLGEDGSLDDLRSFAGQGQLVSARGLGHRRRE